MECTINNVDIDIENVPNMKLSLDISNTIEDEDDNSTSENFDSLPNDDEADEFDSITYSDCQDDSIHDFSAKLQNRSNRINNVQNDALVIAKKTFLPFEPWQPSMSLLELAYKLKQAEYRVFGLANGLQNNTDTVPEASLNDNMFLNTRELGKANRIKNYSLTKLNFHESFDVSGSSSLLDMKRDFYEASSNKLSPAGSMNTVQPRTVFASNDSSYSFKYAPKSSSPHYINNEVNNINHETKGYCFPKINKHEKSVDAINLSSMSLNFSESESRYSASFFDEKRRYPCSYCPYRSDTRSHLKRHELAIHQNGAKARNRLPRVPEHIAAITVPTAGGLGESYYRRHQCDQCMYQTNSACHLRRHQSTMHDNEKPFRCNICLLEFSRSEKVNQHFANFHPGVSFNIKAMRKVVAAEKRSVQMKKSVPVGTVVKRDGTGAEIIDKEGESGDPVDTELAQLIEAAVTARGEGHKPFCCQLCLYTSRDVWHLRRHIADVHLKRRNYRCKVCRYATGRQDRLFTHMRSHGEMFCLYCDYSTAQVETYRAHMQSCSAAGSREVSSWNESGDVSSMIFSEQEQTCRLCNIVFTHCADLIKHINVVHVETLESGSNVNQDFIDLQPPTDTMNFGSLSDFRRYSCRACGHVASDVESIQNHVMSHAPESYECAVADCDFKATYARTLELHQKYYHTGDATVDVSQGTASSPSSKSFTSSLISASSSPVKAFSASDLQSSTFSSSGSTAIMPAFMPSIGQFVCPICKDRAPFKYRRSFEKHITQHSVNVMICPMCVECFLAMDEMHAHMRSAHGANI